MARSFSADNLVTLPKLDARAALTLGAALATAAKTYLTKNKQKEFPPRIAKANAKLTAATAKLQATVASRLSTSSNDSARAQAADRALDAAWSALYDWLTGWSKLPRSPQAKIAAAILVDIYPEGLRFILLAYKLQWAESAARLDKIKSAKHDDAIKTLGGESFLKDLRACHKEYGDALGVTEVPSEKVTTTIREALDAFSTALRKYALTVTAFAEDEDDESSAKMADSLLAPLTAWESTSAPEKPSSEAQPETNEGTPAGAPAAAAEIQGETAEGSP
ncbi:MAG: hypothetical protein HUU21_36205 [Polyangiaceae bacterium]|nr:hypothetical protein [Polyangiaceae bacterium]